MRRPELFQPLLDLMTGEIEQVSRLHEALEAEHHALETRDVAEVERISAQKINIVKSLGTMQPKRQSLLQHLQLPNDKSGFAKLIELADNEEGALAALWGELREKLHACAQQNQVNGRIIEPSRRVTEDALAILLGGGMGELYDQQGAKSPTQRGGRTSFKA